MVIFLGAAFIMAVYFVGLYSRSMHSRKAELILNSLKLIRDEDIVTDVTTEKEHNGWCEKTVRQLAGSMHIVDGSITACSDAISIACIFKVKGETHLLSALYVCRPWFNNIELDSKALKRVAEVHLKTQYPKFKLLQSKVGFIHNCSVTVH